MSDFATRDLFVSHASADKPLVGRLVSELKASLQKIGHPLTVFLDRPLELDGVNPADTGLQINQKWEQQLNIQLEGCKVVVVFWSKNAVLSNWVKAEALRGFDDVSEDDEPKLFNVTLDSDGSAFFDTQLKLNQYLACRLHTMKTPQEHSAALDNLAGAIAKYVKKRRKPKPGRKIPADVLPYLINCSSQVGAIRAELSCLFRPVEIQPGALARRPLFAIAGYTVDSPESLLDRLVRHELPKLASEMNLSSDLQPAAQLSSIGWRRARDSTNAGAAMERDIFNRLKPVGKTRERPALVYTTIREPDKDDLGQLEHWLRGWEKAFAAFPEARAVPLLVVVDKMSFVFDKMPWLFSSDPLGDQILEAVQNHSRGATCGICVERLPPLSIDDALEWRTNYLPDGTGDLHKAVTNFITLKFASARNGRGPRLAEFVRSVMSENEAHWWNDLKRHYEG